MLNDVSFHIRPGESVAIVGATGAGKTSLISILSRFYDIQSGSILLDGVDIRKMRRADVRRHIGAVLQDPVLFSGTVTSTSDSTTRRSRTSRCGGRRCLSTRTSSFSGPRTDTTTS